METLTFPVAGDDLDLVDRDVLLLVLEVHIFQHKRPHVVTEPVRVEVTLCVKKTRARILVE